jgi:hypothetical protein
VGRTVRADGQDEPVDVVHLGDGVSRRLTTVPFGFGCGLTAVPERARALARIVLPVVVPVAILPA